MQIWIAYIEQMENGAPTYTVGAFSSLEALTGVLEEAFGPPDWRRSDQVPGVVRAGLEWDLGEGMTVIVESHEVRA